MSESTLPDQQSTAHHAHLAIVHTERDGSGSVQNSSVSVGESRAVGPARGFPGFAAKCGEVI